MKFFRKLSVIFVVLALTAVLTSCSSSSQASDVAKSDGYDKTSILPTVINAQEYMLYQNVFYGDATPYIDQKVTKEGTFATIYDEFNGTTRYYVWGYYDETKCCDWQWEINVTDTSAMINNGSIVEVTGDFVASENSLDGYWIENPQFTLKKEYEADEQYDVDMATMSCTLERVQMANLQNKAGAFEGKTVRGYGRLDTITSIQDPYYDGSWVMDFDKWEDNSISVGTLTVFTGVWHSGSLNETTLYYNTDFTNIY